MGNNQEKKFKVYKSSAGSGKTFTLVKEFLKLCLKTNNAFTFSSILAITFTNKATYEMKNRILQALEELSKLGKQNKKSVLADILVAEIGLSESEIQSRSEVVLRSILHNYADFNVSTIDRFSHRLIRTFAKDLGLSMGFQVSLEEKELLQLIIGHLIDNVGDDKKVTALLLDFAMYKIEEEKSWDIEKDLLDFSYGLLNENAEQYLEILRENTTEDFDLLKKEYSKANTVFESKIKEVGKKAHELIEANEIDDQSFAGRSKISTYFKKLYQFDSSSLVPTASLLKDIDADNWHSTKCSPEQKLKIDQIKDELFELFNDAQLLINRELKDYLSRTEIIKNIHSLTLLNEIEKSFAVLKKEEKLLNISDFNKLLAQVVLNEPIPFIYERLGERFQHLMIDEFQDTSVLQYMNIMPLIEDSLARGNENIIVGDAKQAIYRFRGGEVDQFAEMPNHLPQIAEKNDIVAMRLETLKSQYKPHHLKVNYRSSKEVVDFNNSFFNFLKSELSLTPKIHQIFDEHEQEFLNQNKSGFVAISFSSERNEDFEEQMNQLVIEDIYESLEDGYQLKDIAILLRRKKEATSLAEFLTKKGLEVISSEALLLNNSKEVRFLINLGKWILSEDNQIFQKDIIEYFYSADLLSGSLDDNFREYLKDSSAFKRVFQQLDIVLDSLALIQLPVNEFFESLVRIFGLDKIYDPYIQGLQDEAFDFSQSINSSIRKFISWWDDNYEKLSIETPDNINAINILTIHKSKGLEFPVVVYPFAKQKVEHSGSMRKDFLWTHTLASPQTNVPYALVEFNTRLLESSLSEVYQAELERKEVDLINDTYVAFTRAADRLYIHSVTPPKSSKLLNLSSILMSFLNHKGLQATEDTQIIFGQRNNIEKENIDESFNTEMQYVSNSWRSKLRISKESEKLWEENEGGESQRKYGTLLHHLMAKIVSTEDISEAVESLILSGDINSEEGKKLEFKINQLVNIPGVAQFFQKGMKVKNEATLIDIQGNIIRPDRVVFSNNSVIVIDYKTGEQNDSHFEQLNNYMSTISATTNLAVKGFLLYTEKEQLVEV